MARRVAALILHALMLVSCNDEDERPPLYTPEPKGTLVACAELGRAESLVVSDELLFLGDDPAQCAVDGLYCPLEALLMPVEVCAPNEQPLARCRLDQWRLVCEAQGAGGTGPDGLSDAGPGGSSGTNGEGGSASQLS